MSDKLQFVVKLWTALTDSPSEHQDREPRMDKQGGILMTVREGTNRRQRNGFTDPARHHSRARALGGISRSGWLHLAPLDPRWSRDGAGIQCSTIHPRH